MKYKNIIIAFSLVALFIGCNQKNKKEADVNRFAGLWSLHVMEQKDSVTGQWREWRDGMQGYILYDDKDNMALHLTTKGYQDTDLRFPNFIDTVPIEALRHLTKSYVYMAKYSIDEENGVVEHARISHSNPRDWNVKVERRFTFSGDTLILQPVEESNSGLRLKWIRSVSGNQ